MSIHPDSMRAGRVALLEKYLRELLFAVEVEHGHHETNEEIWPACLERHAQMRQARAALLASPVAPEEWRTQVEREAVEAYKAEMEMIENPSVHPFTCPCGWTSGPLRFKEQGKGAQAFNDHRQEAHAESGEA